MKIRTPNTFSSLTVTAASFFLLTCSLVILSGCAPKHTTSSVPQSPTLFPHKIKYSGETLAAIAEWYTGTTKNWQVLAAANPDLKPNKLTIGKTVLIPEDLLTRVEPLPKKFLKTLPPKEKTEIKKDGPSLNKRAGEQETAPAPVDGARSVVTPATTPVAEVTETAATTALRPASTPTAPESTSADAMDSAVESLLMEPTPKPSTVSAEEKAREDLIDEILKN